MRDRAPQGSAVLELRRDIADLRAELREVRAQATEAQVAAGIALRSGPERIEQVRSDMVGRIDAVREEAIREAQSYRDTVNEELKRRGGEQRRAAEAAVEARAKAQTAYNAATLTRRELVALGFIHRILVFIGKHKKKFGIGAGGLSALAAILTWLMR